LGFAGQGGIVLGEQIEVEAVGGADGLQGLVGAGTGFGGAFANDAGLEEAAGVLEIAHQIDGTVVRAVDAQMEGDVAVLGADGLEGNHLDAAGQNGFKVLHGQGPGEGFLVEELVESVGLGEQLGVVGALHEGFVILALAGDAGDFAIEGVIAGAGLLGLLVEGVEADAEDDGQKGQNARADAEALEGRSKIGEGAGGEIERDAHGLTCPHESASCGGDVCMTQ
jgi:hypothetical protein